MKKIMFNDKYGLTQAVLEGRKTMTRRVVTGVQLDYIRKGMPGMAVVESRYKVCEVVAVAQSYLAIHEEMMDGDYGDAIYDPFRWAIVDDKPGWSNKMFVKAGLMPHQIRITNVRVERLQDISEEDCIREGIIKKTLCPPGDIDYYYLPNVPVRSKWDCHPTPQEAFSILIDKVSGKGTWESNPWVFVYEFELVI